jgi:hypothetical protein
MPPDGIAEDIHTVIGDQGFTFGDVSSMVRAAESIMCPLGPIDEWPA